MLVAESRAGRRLVGHLDRGVDLPQALIEICRAHQVRAGELRAVGALESVTLREYDQRTRQLGPERRFEAQLEIVGLLGNVCLDGEAVSVQAWASLSRERDNGIELLGGRIVAARVFSVEFVLECFDDLRLRRQIDPQTGLSVWTQAPAGDPQERGAAVVPFEAPAQVQLGTPPAAPPAPAPSWTEVAEVSARAAEPVAAEPESAEPQISAGDVIDHPKFGHCQVERVEGDQEYVSARLRNQRLIRLSLEVFTLVPAGMAEGRRVFKAVLGG